MMKRLGILILALLVVAALLVGGIVLVNMNRGEEETTSLPQSSEQSYAAVEPDAPSQPQSTPDVQTPGTSQPEMLTGKFQCTDEWFVAGYEPTLTLNSDGSFVFLANLAEGMGTLTGTYSQGGDTLWLNVESIDFSGFLGDDLASTTFRVIDDNTLEYTGGDVGIMIAGHVFNRV